MIRPSHVLLFVVALAAPLAAQEKKPGNRFEKEILAYEAADKKSPPEPGAILFAGASGIRLWKTLAQDFPEHRVLNRGFGGSTIADAIHFADRIIIPYQPKLIVLQSGGNDLNGGKSPQQVADDFAAFVAKVRGKLPEVPIVFMSIQPSPARWSQVEKQKETNALIRKLCEAGENLRYLNAFDAFLNADGQPRGELFVDDKLHHNAAGYKVRAELVRPYLGQH
ncbi:MAG: SGNH/GDSL hydrolase family protein [Pirellulaceae bacterium]|nr:SGNH/GDSL hydrolase family protein [Pirellulaceae bacterium]